MTKKLMANWYTKKETIDFLNSIPNLDELDNRLKKYYPHWLGNLGKLKEFELCNTAEEFWIEI